MTKFEEELRNKGVKIFTYMDGCTISKKVFINYADVVNLSEGWVSSEEFQAEKDARKKEYEIHQDIYSKTSKKLNEAELEIANLKSQLQQQALPVVPEFVVEWIECVKGKSKNALALLDDDDMPDDVNEWLFFQRNDDNINLILRAWLNGYEVEKPQLFYLKHIDMSKADKEFDHYLFRIEVDRLAHHIVNKNNLPHNYRSVTFTQQEIDSMETGSYEQIEVTE